MAESRCEYGQVFGECGERNAVRVAHHRVSEDGGERSFMICSNCLGFYFCENANEIATFGFYSIETNEVNDYLENLKLVTFNKEEWDKNLERRSKMGFY
tara:strand:+ start:342 stop:638 length:297 start_codon:yes stop_codon:yes gene_type:complete